MTHELAFFDAIALRYGRQWNMEEENRAAISKLISITSQRILEVGCGNGRALQNLPSGAVGVDYSWKMLAEARRRLPDALLVQAQGERLPFRKEAFDTVVAVNSLHNQVEPKLWLKEIKKLSPKRLILDFRNALNPVVAYKIRKYKKAMQKVKIVYKTYTEKEFSAFIESEGFKIKRKIPLARPISDPNEGFRFRHVGGFLLSLLPGLCPSFGIEAIPIEKRVRETK